MFDFEKLEVYQKAKGYNKLVYSFIQKSKNLDPVVKNQLRRASFSIMLNIAEGSSRFSKADRRNFYVIARGSIFECVAVFEFMRDEALMPPELYESLYAKSEEFSKMLFAMIQNLS